MIECTQLGRVGCIPQANPTTPTSGMNGRFVVYGTSRLGEQTVYEQRGTDDDHCGSGEAADDTGSGRPGVQDGSGEGPKAQVEGCAGEREGQPENADLTGDRPAPMRIGELREQGEEDQQ